MTTKVCLPTRWYFIRTAPLAAFLLIVGVTLYGFYQSEQADRASREQRAELCRNAVTDREALRQVYRDVRDLGVSLIMEGEGAADSPSRAARLAALDAFRDQRLALIPSLPDDCEAQ